MKTLLLFLFWLFPFFLQASPSFTEFKLLPSSLFVDQEGIVLFAVRAQNPSLDPAEVISLIELDKSGEKPKHRWILEDNGILGDRKAQDQIYSREIQFKEKYPRKIEFIVAAVKEKDPTQLPTLTVEEIQKAPRVSLQIQMRPTFIDLMRQVWRRIKD